MHGVVGLPGVNAAAAGLLPAALHTPGWTSAIKDRPIS
jgi:hypothetical protein